MRIYELAKKLRINANLTLELCNKAGYSAKSLLASISEEEAQGVEVYLKSHPDALLSNGSGTSATEKIIKRGMNNSTRGKSVTQIQPPSITSGKIDTSGGTTGRVPNLANRRSFLPPSLTKRVSEPQGGSNLPSGSVSRASVLPANPGVVVVPEIKPEVATVFLGGRGVTEEPPTKPDVAEVAEVKPGVAEVAEAKPDVAEVAEAKPEVTEVAEAKPDVTEVAPAKPDVAEVAPAKPAVAEVAPAKPAVTEVAPAKPAVTEVAPAKPDVAEGAEAKPAVTEVAKAKPDADPAADSASRSTGSTTLSAEEMRHYQPEIKRPNFPTGPSRVPVLKLSPTSRSVPPLTPQNKSASQSQQDAAVVTATEKTSRIEESAVPSDSRSQDGNPQNKGSASDVSDVAVTEVSAGAAKQNAPEVKQSAPEAKQSTPEAKQCAPEAKQSTPEVKQSAPEAKQSAAAAKQSAPEAKRGEMPAKTSGTRPQRQGPLSLFRSKAGSNASKEGSPAEDKQVSAEVKQVSVVSVSQQPPVEQLSPLEKARLAAAKEASRRPQVLGDIKRGTGSAVKTDRAQKTKQNKPVSAAIRLAPMPETRERPVVQTKERAQKPEIRLNPQAIRDASEGRTAPLADIMREQVHRAKKERAEKNTDVSSFSSDRKKGQRLRSSDVFLDDESTEKRGKRSKDKRHMGGDDSLSKKRRNFNAADRGDDDAVERYRPRQHKTKSGGGAVVTAPRKGDIVIQMPCTVKEFAEATGLSVAAVIKKTMELGAMLTINRSLDEEIAELLIEAFELKAQIKKEQTLEDQFVTTVEEQVDPVETLRPRAPVVTFLGHVDHGKTSLLDKILKLNVVSGERGGITQHIRAYHVETELGGVTFVDTPGHEAFTEMRARGANCTDIAVLVVAADDGVMPQTEEAISHAKAAGVPIVVALNKMDLPGANRERTIQQLANNDLMPSEWGGDVEIIETSAVTGNGIDTLLETLLMVAELHELKARPDRPATGVALESALEPGQGVTCKLLVQNGTLKSGDVVLCGNAYGRVRAMFDTLDSSKEVTEAGPSIPVTLLGLDTAPSAGSRFVVLPDISVARQIAEDRTAQLHARELLGEQAHVTLETLKERLDSSRQAQILNVIIRADVRGSIEAIRKELGKLDHPEVKIKILQATVGGVTEADVLLADASDAIIVGFNVVPDERARNLAEQKKIQIRRYDIIYKLSEDIKAALSGMLKPIEQVKELGRALVQRTFSISRVGTIAGCRVLAGTMERDCTIRVIRNSQIIGEYQLETLKREKDDAREVREGYECGIKLKGYNDLKEGDIFEAYKIEEIARSL